MVSIFFHELYTVYSICYLLSTANNSSQTFISICQVYMLLTHCVLWSNHENEQKRYIRLVLIYVQSYIIVCITCIIVCTYFCIFVHIIVQTVWRDFGLFLDYNMKIAFINAFLARI
jgi:hypothetical protein